ncbi:ATP-binding protein [Streptomyces rishiriensis]|uniref:Anti-sigma regulatory factor (Ser/Thr protein kinase) n=1 Tax=Streptomyces rishiriensis TaxID=68264 RepID=A0ABU0NNP2_STRRH|nr:ATP-binding protein [Streptomyces rishiriensis]MDQ0580704.1 anti-sigma regulatory factor (Ser/Thr protein kinase) [Streptomyces rishiriensis]
MNGYFPSIYASPVPTQYRMTLTAGEHSARHIRRIARMHLQNWELQHLTDTVALALTELIANVIRHVPDSHCTVLLLKQRTGIRAEVTDAYGQLLPAPAKSAPESEGGRGLLLLDALVDKWGVSPTAGGGKTVWFECEAVTSHGRAEPDR